MGLIDFNKPEKIRSTESHNRMYMSDSGIDGTYVQNMSEEDKYKWKGKHIKKGDDPRIEIRKTFQFYNGKHHSDKGYFNSYAQIVIIVRPPYQTNYPHVLISTNGKIGMSSEDYIEMTQVIEEAKSLLI